MPERVPPARAVPHAPPARPAAAARAATARSSSTSTARCSTSRRRPTACASTARVTGLLPALARRLGGALALITGRSIADADRLFPGIRLPIAGQHGVERRDAGGAMHRHARRAGHRARCGASCSGFAAGHDGLLLEDKGETLALHYRQAPRLASHVHRTVRAHVAVARRCASAWRLQPGKGLIEVQAGRTRQGHGDRRVHDRAAVSRPHAGVRRRRPHRRIRLRRGRARRGMGGQGRRGADARAAIGCATSPRCATGSPAPSTRRQAATED